MMNNFNASIKFDKRLCFQDLKLNKAHSCMLADKKIITSNENKKIQKGLKLIENELSGTDTLRLLFRAQKDSTDLQTSSGNPLKTAKTIYGLKELQDWLFQG